MLHLVVLDHLVEDLGLIHHLGFDMVLGLQRLYKDMAFKALAFSERR